MEPLLALEALARTARDEGRVVKALLRGDDGLGRTSTLDALSGRLQSQGFIDVRVALRRGPAAAALLEVLTGPVPKDDGQVVAALEQSPALAGLEAVERRAAAELLASCVGVLSPDFGTASLDADSRREGAFAELGGCLSRRAARGPLLLAFDDGHEGTDDDAALLDFLGNLSQALPMLLVVTAGEARAGAGAGPRLEAWRSEPTWAQLALEPLSEADLRAACGEGLPPDVVDAIVGRAGGVPGRARALADFARRSPGQPLPATPDALRIDAVRAAGDAALTLAARAAALGEEVPLEALAAAGVDVAAVAALEAAGVAGRVGRAGDERLRFSDARTREALAGAVAGAELAPLRRAAADWAVGQLAGARRGGLGRLVALATPALDVESASLWREAAAGDGEDTLLSLRAALDGATGVRRLVLLRRVADGLTLAGRPDEALAMLREVGRGLPMRSALPATPAGRGAEAAMQGALERWHELTPEAALAAVELSRAQALSHLVKKEETRAAYTALEARLGRLSGPVAAQLWVRWAKEWVWFLCEILRQPLDACRACETVRARTPAALLESRELALGLVRAEAVATSSAGDFARGLERVEAHLRLASSPPNLREGSLAWNARAILHFGQGDLAHARRAFERAIEQARGTGWLRRDAISTHNLALVLCEMGAWDEAHAAETRYARLSVTIGNHAATAEAPAVLAGVALGRGDLTAAQGHLAEATRAAEANDWAMLMAWARVLSARLRVQRYVGSGDRLDLSRAKNDLLAALNALEEHSPTWSEELDSGEVYALYAATQHLTGQTAQARATLERARRLIPGQSVVSHHSVALGEAFVVGGGPGVALAWFEARGYVRVTGFWRALM